MIAISANSPSAGFTSLADSAAAGLSGLPPAAMSASAAAVLSGLRKYSSTLRTIAMSDSVSKSVMDFFREIAMENPPTARGTLLAGYLLGTGAHNPSNSLFAALSPFPQQGFSKSLFNVATVGFRAFFFVSAGFLLFVFWVVF